MREIKFRAYDMATQDFWEPKPQGIIEFDITSVPSFINHTHNENGKWERRFKIVEFTGAKDKNGADIYEGDIVSCNILPMPLEVYYAEEVGMFRLGHQEDDYGDFVEFEPSDFSVIGNIHQNPELLEERS
jgi:uncharacterized phage protein (TIGR01671 family)